MELKSLRAFFRELQQKHKERPAQAKLHLTLHQYAQGCFEGEYGEYGDMSGTPADSQIVTSADKCLHATRADDHVDAYLQLKRQTTGEYTCYSD